MKFYSLDSLITYLDFHHVTFYRFTALPDDRFHPYLFKINALSEPLVIYSSLPSLTTIYNQQLHDMIRSYRQLSQPLPFLFKRWQSIYYIQQRLESLFRSPVRIIETIPHTYPSYQQNHIYKSLGHTRLGTQFTTNRFHYLLEIGPMSFTHYLSCRHLADRPARFIIATQTVPNAVLGNNRLGKLFLKSPSYPHHNIIEDTAECFTIPRHLV